VYNVGSADEVSNLELCTHLLREFGHDSSDFDAVVGHTTDRPFNDRRYAVDATKLQMLGWRQKTRFEDGLRTTVEWYRKFGEEWWGDVGAVLAEQGSGKKKRLGFLRG
jgi:dTDP-D-glucose 4,6-dehydratase